MLGPGRSQPDEREADRPGHGSGSGRTAARSCHQGTAHQVPAASDHDPHGRAGRHLCLHRLQGRRGKRPGARIPEGRPGHQGPARPDAAAASRSASDDRPRRAPRTWQHGHGQVHPGQCRGCGVHRLAGQARRRRLPGRQGHRSRGQGVVKAAGPLGKVIEADSTRINPGDDYPARFTFGSGANSLIMMNRIAFFSEDERKDELDAEGQNALLRWADKNQLGQHSELLGWFTARRNAALTELGRQGLTVRRFRAEPEWRLAVGLGNKANPYEIGLSLHGTYGWPVIPATSLKGLAAGWAVASGADHRDVRRVLGTPRLDVPPAPAPKYNPDDSERLAGELLASRGTVCFLDAIPAAK